MPTVHCASALPPLRRPAPQFSSLPDSTQTRQAKSVRPSVTGMVSRVRAVRILETCGEQCQSCCVYAHVACRAVLISIASSFVRLSVRFARTFPLARTCSDEHQISSLSCESLLSCPSTLSPFPHEGATSALRARSAFRFQVQIPLSHSTPSVLRSLIPSHDFLAALSNLSIDTREDGQTDSSQLCQRSAPLLRRRESHRIRVLISLPYRSARSN